MVWSRDVKPAIHYDQDKDQFFRGGGAISFDDAKEDYEAEENDFLHWTGVAIEEMGNRGHAAPDSPGEGPVIFIH